MNLYEVTNGYESCWVIAPSKEWALTDKNVEEYFEESEETIEVIKLENNKELTIAIEDGKFVITHTAEEWVSIYSGLPSLIAQSEW